MRLGFLASHRGSNMQAVIDACTEGRLRAVPALVISNNRNAEAIARARTRQIPTAFLNSVTHPISEELDLAILEALERQHCDLIVLAGFMKKIGPHVLDVFAGRILNVHPALLPKFGGQGMFGSHVHKAVLAAKEKVTGVSVHLVDAEYDHGRVLAQEQVAVMDDDSVESLSARVLQKEHEVLVRTLERILSGEIVLSEKRRKRRKIALI